MTTTWFITGCSSGLGRALARAALQRGDRVAVTARDPRAVADLVERYPESALAVALDVTDPDQRSTAVRAAGDRFGSIDVLVNNAGYGYRAAVEEGEDAEVRAQFETHFFGPVALIQAVLPGMRARRRGTIVNLSSVGTRWMPEGSGYYVAAKSAVEGLTGSLRRELTPLGIRAMVVAPGALRTDYAGRSLTESRVPIADYASTAGTRRRAADATDGTQRGDPARAAQAIIRAVDSPEPPFMLVLGPDALGTFRAAGDTLSAELDAWEATSLSTDFQDSHEKEA